MKKPVSGVGINDADYRIHDYSFSINSSGGKVRKLEWVCPYYTKWSNMLKRCYDKIYLIRYPTYADCSVCDDWIYFSNFKSWMEKQNWEGRHLDKDILFPGNKLYSPDTCVFVSPCTNYFMLEHNASRGEYPVGVSKHKRTNYYVAQCKPAIGDKSKHLGLFKTVEEAHSAWLEYKLEQAIILAEQQDDDRVAKALIDRYVNYTFYKENNIILG